jgi:D-alanine transfer protein
MRVAHLASVLIAVAVLAATLVGAEGYAQSVEAQYIHALAPLHSPMSVAGSALQKAAFHQPDLLPVYGSSEVIMEPSMYQASQFFKNYPTGFETFEIASSNAFSLITAQQIASLGPDLRGKKVVISFTPSDFDVKEDSPDAYAAAFSQLHANELVFSELLSIGTKRLAAQRMLQYPNTLDRDPILRFALQNLADGSQLGVLLYYAVWPLGKLQTFIQELQDHYQTIIYIQSLNGLRPDVKHQPATATPDWTALATKAESESIAQADNNPFGFDSAVWLKYYAKTFKPSSSAGGADEYYLGDLTISKEWPDFEILMRVLQELGAQPLLLGRPMKASFLVASGISLSAQQVFYTKMRWIAQQYSLPLVDFQGHQNDTFFDMDLAHASRIGWVYVDQILDQFYHGALH